MAKSEPGGGVEAKLRVLFCRLRDQVLKEQQITNRVLASRLGVSPSNVSRWATGHDGRQAPLWVIRWLLKETDRACLLVDDQMVIIPAVAGRILAGYDGVPPSAVVGPEGPRLTSGSVASVAGLTAPA